MLDLHIRQRLGTFRLDIAFTAEERGVTALFGRSGSGFSFFHSFGSSGASTSLANVSLAASMSVELS